MDEVLEAILACPRDYKKLKKGEDFLVCPEGHKYPIVEGIPVLLCEEKSSTQPEIFKRSLSQIGQGDRVACSEDKIDSYVQEVIAATCGGMYKPLINKLSSYPIPSLPLADGRGGYFLEVGCNWGRWCIAAAKLGYKVIGIDHNLDALMAARRVSKQLGVDIMPLVADARYLPFTENIFSVIFSYSVLQHFAKEDVRLCLLEFSRLLRQGGICLIQMPNIFGLRNCYQQLKRNLREPTGFEVRYWRLAELITELNIIGATKIFAEAFFSLNAGLSDNTILSLRYRLVVKVSEILCRLSRKMPGLNHIVDSLYVEARKA